MLCKNCQNEIASDALFCTNCGTPVERTSENVMLSTVENSMNENKAKKKSLNRVASVTGIVFMVLGIVFFCMSFSTLHVTSFGGDFYTYTYKGLCAISSLLSLLAKIGSCILFGLGLSMTCYFGEKK